MKSKPSTTRRRGYCGIPNNSTCERYHNHASTQSSPLPFSMTPAGSKYPNLWFIESALEDRGSFDALTGRKIGKERRLIARVNVESNAALIVRRVNQGPAFDAMVNAMEYVLANSGPNDWPDARAALKLAQEVSK